LVEHLGARYDLTLEPGQKGGQYGEPFLGAFPDYRHVPHYPYRPAQHDFRVPGILFRRKLWMIPLSVGSANWKPMSCSRTEAWVSLEERRNLAALAPQKGSFSIAHSPNNHYEGCLDRVDSEVISGWGYDVNNPNIPIDVEIQDGEVLLTRATAATFRADLCAAGKGNGKHAFTIPVPDWMKDGKSRLIQVKIANSSFSLPNSPQKLTIDKQSAAEEYRTLNLAADPWFMCHLIETLLTNVRRRYLAMMIRSDAAIHTDQLSNMEQVFNYLLSHPLMKHLAFVTPDKLIKDM
jgi:hypothetical protein